MKKLPSHASHVGYSTQLCLSDVSLEAEGFHWNKRQLAERTKS